MGQVVKGIRDGLHEVALKISKSNPSQNLLLKEMALLKSCRNSNVVQVASTCTVPVSTCSLYSLTCPVFAHYGYGRYYSCILILYLVFTDH
jgi:hypothetical protein